MFGNCEIQMPSSRRIFPLLGTSGHPLGLCFSSSPHFCLRSLSLAYEFAKQIVQLIYSSALIRGLEGVSKGKPGVGFAPGDPDRDVYVPSPPPALARAAEGLRLLWHVGQKAMALLAGSSLVGMAGEGKPRGMHPKHQDGCLALAQSS